MSSSANARILGAAEALKESRAEDASLEPLKGLDDEALMYRVQRADLKAFEVLFDRHSDLVLRVGTRLFRNATEADDLVQEVFLYVFRKSHVFDCSKG